MEGEVKIIWRKSEPSDGNHDSDGVADLKISETTRAAVASRPPRESGRMSRVHTRMVESPTLTPRRVPATRETDLYLEGGVPATKPYSFNQIDDTTLPSW
jgi:hypothetical protein